MGSDHLFENRNSFASQFIRHKARRLARHPGFHKSERHDIEQELALELVHKFDSYDPDRASETTFIARVVERKAASLARARTAQMRDFRREACSLDETVRDGEGESIQRAQTLEAESARSHTGRVPRSDQERTQLRLDLTEVLDALPEDLRELARRLSEMSQLAAGRELGRPRWRMAKDMARLRERFEDAGLRLYL